MEKAANYRIIGKNNKLRGKAKEMSVAYHEHGLGNYVMLSSGSHGHFDMISIPIRSIDQDLPNPDEPVRLIQVKSVKPSNEELETLSRQVRRMKSNVIGLVVVCPYKSSNKGWKWIYL